MWQKTQETSINQRSLNSFNNDSDVQYAQETQMTNVASQILPPKRIQPQNNVTAKEQPPGYKTRREPVPFLRSPNSCPTDN